jgi:hypothetical protein
MLVSNDLFIAAVVPTAQNDIDIRPFHREGVYKSKMTGTSGQRIDVTVACAILYFPHRLLIDYRTIKEYIHVQEESMHLWAKDDMRSIFHPKRFVYYTMVCWFTNIVPRNKLSILLIWITDD